MHPNWIVLAGAPSSGKTTLLEELRRQGFPCATEPARAYMEQELKKGVPMEVIRADQEVLERRVKEWERADRASLPKDALVFVDSATDVDALAYMRWFGIEPSASWIDDARAVWFGAVYIMDRLPFELDGLRTENDVVAEFLDRELEKVYRLQGARVVRVPLLPPAERAAFILEDLRAHGQLLAA
ncbi:MAG: ATP-binding protein [Verrucomicrobium sp.]|nr:ATP-binding protein [Verrucomicrobium sp.]